MGNFSLYCFCFSFSCIASWTYDRKFKSVNCFICCLLYYYCSDWLWYINWWNKSTASGIRNYKDYQSELENGIEREITITAEDGREIFHYEGKVDVESNHDDNYIKFEGENGKRYVIYYGVQDTIKIIEK